MPLFLFLPVDFMALLGSGALAMWWDMAPALRAEFEDWHSHEHFPERMGIPGFRRGTRWADIEGGEGFFVLYELADYETLTSAPYLERLNDPTPWSTRMMPHHRNMVRSQCRVLESFGSAAAGFLATLRLSPKDNRDEALRNHLQQALSQLPAMPGIVGGHLLRTDTPAGQQTQEQKIRGGDAAADWIVLVAGYDQAVLRSLLSERFGPRTLVDAGPELNASMFRLSFTMTPADLK